MDNRYNTRRNDNIVIPRKFKNAGSLNSQYVNQRKVENSIMGAPMLSLPMIREMLEMKKLLNTKLVDKRDAVREQRLRQLQAVEQCVGQKFTKYSAYVASTEQADGTKAVVH